MAPTVKIGAPVAAQLVYRIDTFQRRDRLGRLRFYFRGVARNGETVFPSEAYVRRIDRDDIANRLAEQFINRIAVEETTR